MSTIPTIGARHAPWCRADCGATFECEVCGDRSGLCLGHEEDCSGCEGARCGPCCDDAEEEAAREAEEWAEDTEP